MYNTVCIPCTVLLLICISVSVFLSLCLSLMQAHILMLKFRTISSYGEGMLFTGSITNTITPEPCHVEVGEVLSPLRSH